MFFVFWFPSSFKYFFGIIRCIFQPHVSDLDVAHTLTHCLSATALGWLGCSAYLAAGARETTIRRTARPSAGQKTHHARVFVSQGCSCLNRTHTGLAGTAISPCGKLLGLLLSSNRVCLRLLHHRLDHTLLLR